MDHKLTPDQLHRLIDEVAALAYLRKYEAGSFFSACRAADAIDWWRDTGVEVYERAGKGHAGLSAVLILLSEGG